MELAPTYLFYDIETTGLNPCFDQVLQFAAIRTDTQLKELERYEYHVRLNPDAIPSPYALITHRIGIKKTQLGDSEYHVIQKIHRLFNTPNTITLGYNTLGFDDEFLRFSFYRNLLSPYTHQFANGCSRMDLYPITILFYLHQPEALEWPIINGQVSLKLENLNAANQFTTGQAHNAMVDVIATLELARKLECFTPLWRYAHGYFNKKMDIHRQKTLTRTLKIGQRHYVQALIVQGKLGIKHRYQAPVLGLGPHYHYKNQTLWLRLDTPLLTETTLETIAQTTWVVRKKAGEHVFILPLEKYQINHHPAAAEHQTLIEKNSQWLEQHPELLEAIQHYHCHYQYPTIPNVDVDAALYTSGFTPETVEKLCQQFHYASPQDKPMMARLFTDAQKRQQAWRLIARHFPEGLNQTQQTQFTHYLQRLHRGTATQLPIDYRGQTKLSGLAALTQIETLQQETSLDAMQRELLLDLQKYLSAGSMSDDPGHTWARCALI